MKSEDKKFERSEKRTTYSLYWDTIVGLESRLLWDFLKEGSITKGMDLLMVSVGVRLGESKVTKLIHHFQPENYKYVDAALSILR